MRAFMGRTGEADHGRMCLDCNWFPSGHIGGIHDRQKHAEREARAILAETEPIPDGCSQAERLFRGPLGSAPDGTAELADALRAFVGEPCRCAGGVHWSPERGYWHCNGIKQEL